MPTFLFMPPERVVDQHRGQPIPVEVTCSNEETAREAASVLALNRHLVQVEPEEWTLKAIDGVIDPDFAAEGTSSLSRIAPSDEVDAVLGDDEATQTPLHELIALAREQGLHVDFAIYADDGDYRGGARITGHKGDPMDVMRAGVTALKAS